MLTILLTNAFYHLWIFEWLAIFGDGRKCLEDDVHSKWSHSVHTREKNYKVAGHLTFDRQLNIQILANKLNISKEEVIQIFCTRSILTKFKDADVIKKTVMPTLNAFRK